MSAAPIIDISSRELHNTLAQDVKAMLRPADGGEKKLPTLLLYDEAGLKIFEDITYLNEYYLTGAEIEILQKHAASIAERIPENAIIVELGSGTKGLLTNVLKGLVFDLRLTRDRNLRKVNILLTALDEAEKSVDYYALDISLQELKRTLSEVPPGKFQHVKCHGLYGTYDDGLVWLQSETIKDRPKCVMKLGSSIGNFNRSSAAEFLEGFLKHMSPTDMLVVGIDNCQDPERVLHAYNDQEGLTHRFILNGLENANRALGREEFEIGQWKVIGEYDISAGRHQAFVSPVKDVYIDGVKIIAGERVRIEESYKYSELQENKLWKDSGAACYARYGNSDGVYHIAMVTRADHVFSLDPKEYAASAVPTFHDWKQLWASWDLVTRGMIIKEELLSKPIKLRNCCLFYLGHIPTFLDIHLTRATGEKLTPPDHYSSIFERGIDPDVDNPEHCHAHSEIPDEWPPVEQVLKYQEDVRQRVKCLYGDEKFEESVILRRTLNLAFEHEIMHLETFLYMLLQSEQVVPPPGVRPDFAALADEAIARAVPNKWFRIPANTVVLGREDDEHNCNVGHFFGWDNESPARKASVPEFEAQGRPLTNEDYAIYMVSEGLSTAPASWTSHSRPDSGHGSCHSSDRSTDGVDNIIQEAFDDLVDRVAVKTVFGPVPLRLALSWPVWASYDELAACASYFGGRIPTVEEAQSIYYYAEQQRVEDLSHVSPQTIPAVNGHLSNNGVHQTPPELSTETDDGGPVSLSETAAMGERDSLFVDLHGANVGFTHFHPMPVLQNGDKLAGLGQMGGVWEWTSTPLQKYDGFKEMEVYPGYTADFFDGKHNIVLGGSWATHPRIAGRKSL